MQNSMAVKTANNGARNVAKKAFIAVDSALVGMAEASDNADLPTTMARQHLWREGRKKRLKRRRSKTSHVQKEK